MPEYLRDRGWAIGQLQMLNCRVRSRTSRAASGLAALLVLVPLASCGIFGDPYYPEVASAVTTDGDLEIVLPILVEEPPVVAQVYSGDNVIWTGRNPLLSAQSRFVPLTSEIWKSSTGDYSALVGEGSVDIVIETESMSLTATAPKQPPPDNASAGGVEH